MPILALGVSHRRASVELLERLAFADDELPKAYRHLTDAPPVAGSVILSTCNRIEVYAEVASYHAGFLALKRCLAESADLDPEAFAEPLYAHYETDAAEHLFGVASGLDSMVRGEPQILSQVRRALRLAEEEGAAGRVLGSLFRAAVRTGRRVRAGTAIGASPTAFVDAGLRLAGRSLGELRGRPALVVGAGQMASLVVTQLREHGADPIRVVGRNAERARALAQRAGGEAHSLADLRRAMADAQLVVACTGAAGLVVMAEDVAAANDPVAAGHRRRFFLDLAVPRDVDPAVAGLPGMRLADVDDLKAAVEGSGDADQVFAQAEVIVAEEVRRFADRQRAARLAPLIQALRDRGERILAAELSKAAPRLASLQPRERAAVDALARAIVAKLLHEPIVRVKALPAADGANPGDANARALAELFGLDQAGDPPTA